MKKAKLLQIFILIAGLMISSVGWGQYSGTGTFIKITDINDLEDNYYVIVNSGDGFAMNKTNAGTFFTHTAVTPSNNTITNPGKNIVWKIETDGEGRTIYNEEGAIYVSYSGTKNEAHAVASVMGDEQRWKITYDQGVFSFANKEISARLLQYNSQNPRFACYTTAQQKLLLYKFESAVIDPEPSNHVTNFTVATGTPAYSVIDLVWDDATGNQLPAGYLIKGSSEGYSSITAPIDGTPEADGPFVKNIAYGVETASFTGLEENTTYYFKVYPYTNGGDKIDYKTDGNVPQDYASTTYGIPAAPVATAATNVSHHGFTANWNAIAGATGYQLYVYTKTGGSPTNILSEDFDRFSAGSPNGSAHGTDISGSLDDYTQVTGWTGDKVYQAGGTAKIGTASALGHLETPAIDLSANSGAFTIDFKAMAWSGDADEMKIYLNETLVLTVTGLNNDATYTLSPYSFNLEGGTASSTLKFEGKQATKGRFFLEDIVISQGGYTLTPVTGSPFTVTGSTSKQITGLSAETEYFYVVKATNEAGTSEDSNEISVTTGAEPVSSTYTGTGNWSDGSHWSNGMPGENTNVTIEGFVTIIDESEVAECNNLTISPTSQVTVDPDNGLLIINGNLLIKSDASGTGSFIGYTENEKSNYEVLGTTSVERYLTGHNNVADAGWHLLSSPVEDFDILGSSFAPGSSDDFYGWSETDDLWKNYKAGDPTQMEFGLGYLVAYKDAGVKTFTGTLNTDNIVFENLSLTGTSSYSGWHLLGNPYASAITWNSDEKWILENVANVAKIWKESAKSYSDIDEDGIIPSAQGFMVQVGDTDNEILAFAADIQVHANTPYYKSTKERLLLVASETEGGSAQESVIQINPSATEGFDFKYDSRFMSGYAPLFYSIAGDEKLSTNSLPKITSEMVIPFRFVKNSATFYEISLEQNIDGLTVYLTDKKENILHNLSDNPVYSFSASTGDSPDRFLITFGAVAVNELADQTNIQAYLYASMLYLLNGNGQTTVQVYDVQGRLLQSFDQNIEGYYSKPFNLPAGLYIIRLSDNTGVHSAKVIKNY